MTPSKFVIAGCPVLVIPNEDGQSPYLTSVCYTSIDLPAGYEEYKKSNTPWRCAIYCLTKRPNPIGHGWIDAIGVSSPIGEENFEYDIRNRIWKVALRSL